MAKILIILPDLRGGGAERIHVNLANEWVTYGYNVEFVLMQKHGELLPMLSPKILITTLNVNRIRKLICPLRKFLIKSNPDIVLAAMWPLTSVTVIAWLLSGKCGRLFLSDHNELSISCVEELGISPILLKLVIKTTYPFSSGIIAVSQGVKNDICQIANFKKNMVKVIYNPVAREVYKDYLDNSYIDRGEIWGKGYSHHILSVGTLKKQKDHETLIKSFSLIANHVNAKLIIVGDGPLMGELKRLIENLCLTDRILMPGFFVDPSPWFLTADIFVLSSRWEGFGNVIVEALECGVNIISTDCRSGPSEILENGRYGKLVPVGDADALAKAMINVINNNKLEKDILIDRSTFFSVKKISKEYISYFDTYHEK